jgi:luciferase family oxidoreductase group 1
MAAVLSLSILDFQHPGASVALACAADEWGFKRYWLGEHHSPFQCANPVLLGALLAGTTERIRIGSGGVSLTYRSTLQIAEDARLVEFMLPGRFDLGVTRGLLENGPVASELLGGRSPLSGSGYAEKVRDLHGLVTGRLPAGHPLTGTPPYLEAGPPLWVLGLSPDSASLAGRLGVGFCFSVHHSGQEIDGPAVLRRYRDSFVPSAELAEPASIIVVRCVCARTEAEAKSADSQLVVPPVPQDQTILGSSRQCADRIAEIAKQFSTDEVMIIDFIQKDQDVRLEMYRLLSEEFSLPSSIDRSSDSPPRP